jgi:hypothetical protein
MSLRKSHRYSENHITAGHPWLTPVILATWEAKIWRIAVPGQTQQIVRNSISRNNQSKIDCRYYLSGRAPALQRYALPPQKPWVHTPVPPKKKKRKKEKIKKITSQPLVLWEIKLFPSNCSSLRFKGSHAHTV